jgi:hypothetical protein
MVSYFRRRSTATRLQLDGSFAGPEHLPGRTRARVPLAGSATGAPHPADIRVSKLRGAGVESPDVRTGSSAVMAAFVPDPVGAARRHIERGTTSHSTSSARSDCESLHRPRNRTPPFGLMIYFFPNGGATSSCRPRRLGRAPAPLLSTVPGCTYDGPMLGARRLSLLIEAPENLML